MKRTYRRGVETHCNGMLGGWTRDLSVHIATEPLHGYHGRLIEVLTENGGLNFRVAERILPLRSPLT